MLHLLAIHRWLTKCIEFLDFLIENTVSCHWTQGNHWLPPSFNYYDIWCLLRPVISIRRSKIGNNLKGDSVVPGDFLLINHFCSAQNGACYLEGTFMQNGDMLYCSIQFYIKIVFLCKRSNRWRKSFHYRYTIYGHSSAVIYLTSFHFSIIFPFFCFCSKTTWAS